MKNLKLTSINYSLSFEPKTLQEWKDNLFQELSTHLANDADVILYPELFFMGIVRYIEEKDCLLQISIVADFVWNELLPEICKFLCNSESLIVLGTAPRKMNGYIFNTSPILLKGRVLQQDKLNLTPWENNFTPGAELRPFLFKDLNTIVLICFDIEQPGLIATLKNIGIDLILVPSATTDRNGCERVNRCASSRAVELGAVVLTSLLVGDSSCELVDHNEGKHGLYLPAQDIVSLSREVESDYSLTEQIVGHYKISFEMIRLLKDQSLETKPYLNIEKDYTIMPWKF